MSILIKYPGKIHLEKIVLVFENSYLLIIKHI